MSQPHPNTTYYLLFKEISIHDYQQMFLYRENNSLKYNALSIVNQDSYSRYGILLKKSKSGQFKQRYFKLLKDTLLYYKKTKNRKPSVINLKQSNLFLHTP